MLQSPTCVYSVSFGSRLHSHLRSTSLSKQHSHTVQKSFVPDPEISEWLCENLAQGKGSNCPPLFWRQLKRNYTQDVGYWPVITAVSGKNIRDNEKAKYSQFSLG